MSKNTNLLKAKKEANDEFYTQYEDIAKEIEHYKEHLKGKGKIDDRAYDALMSYKVEITD